MPDPPPQRTVVERLSGLWQKIREHKLVQWALAYLGLSLALLHGLELVGQAFHWSMLVPRIAIAILATGLPIVLVLAWYHGEKGHQRFTHGEMTIISFVLVIGAGLLWIFARPQPNDNAREGADVPRVEAARTLPSAPEPEAAPTSSRLKLAVLPFENLSPDPGNAFFAEGMHEEVLTTLANRTANLDVISRTTMLMYRNTPKSVADLVKELGITHVLEGSVRREGQEVRFTVQLIDARSDDEVWSHSYDRQLVNAMSLQEEIAADVASQLAVRLLSPTQEPGDSSTDADAYDLYLKAKLALQSFNPGTTLEQYLVAENMLDQAIERDERFASAYLLRARVHLWMFSQGHEMNESRLRLIRDDIAKTRQLTGPSSMIVAVQGLYVWAAEEDFGRALTLLESAESAVASDPEITAAKALLLIRMGRMEDALAIRRSEVARDPRNLDAHVELMLGFWAALHAGEAFRVRRFINERFAAPIGSGWEVLCGQMVFAFTGDLEEWTKARIPGPIAPDMALHSSLELLKYEHRFEDAVRLLDEQTVESMPVVSQGGVPLTSTGSRPKSQVRGWMNMLGGNRIAAAEDGRRVLRFIAQEPRTRWNDWLLQLLAAEAALMKGDKKQAAREADAVMASFPRARDALKWRYVAGACARIYAWAGEGDKAVALLEALVTAAPGVGPAQVTRDPLYSMPLAGNARYQALAQKLEAEIVSNHRLL